jgi:hypothetical protein
MLVKYRSFDENNPGVFRVTMLVLPESESVTEYLSRRPPGPERWLVKSKAEQVSVGGRPADRLTYAGFWKGQRTEEPMTKEVVAVRRGNRVYFFTGIFQWGDRQTRDVTRQAVASVAWDS